MILYVTLQVLATVVPLLLAVAFATLVERKVMGAMQRRVGPNVWGFTGVLQPFFDGLKLFVKEPILPSNADQPLFWWAPILAFLTSQASWAALPTSDAGAVRDLNLGTMYVLAIGSLGVYGVLLAGWASNSKYAFLGCCRSVAQMISYELPMGLVVLTVCVVAGSLNWSALVRCQEYGWLLWPLWPMALIWGVCCLAETNRAPFDLPEAEAELVAGYNVEYASMGFALFFIAEYANLLLMGRITSLLFFGGTSAPIRLLNWIPGRFWLAIKATLVVFCFIWVRATLPRYRYDQLMRLGWKVFLPLTLAGFVATAALVHSFQQVSSQSFLLSLNRLFNILTIFVFHLFTLVHSFQQVSSQSFLLSLNRLFNILTIFVFHLFTKATKLCTSLSKIKSNFHQRWKAGRVQVKSNFHQRSKAKMMR